MEILSQQNQNSLGKQGDLMNLHEKKVEMLSQIEAEKADIENKYQKREDFLNEKMDNVIKDMAVEDISTKGFIGEQTKEIMNLFGSKQVFLDLDNVLKIDSAKGDLHIYQEKADCKKNYLGKKVEHNGVKMIQKMSDAMDLSSAREKLKEHLHRDKERALQQGIKQPTPSMSMGRGL